MFCRGNIEVEGKQNSQFPAGPVIVFCYTSQLKTRENCEDIVCFMPSGSKICHVFKGAQPDHLQVKSSCCGLPGELVSFVHPKELHVVSFVHPRELVSFDPWDMTHFPRTIRNGI